MLRRKFKCRRLNSSILVGIFVIGLALSRETATAHGRFTGQTRGDSKSDLAPSPAEVERAIELATGYLERACGPDGKFAYRVDIGSGRESSSYDIIRHEVAVYGLAMTNQHHPDPKTAEAMVRAARFLR